MTGNANDPEARSTRIGIRTSLVRGLLWFALALSQKFDSLKHGQCALPLWLAITRQTNTGALTSRRDLGQQHPKRAPASASPGTLMRGCSAVSGFQWLIRHACERSLQEVPSTSVLRRSSKTNHTPPPPAPHETTRYGCVRSHV